MKKILLVLIILLSLVGCNQDKTKNVTYDSNYEFIVNNQRIELAEERSIYQIDAELIPTENKLKAQQIINYYNNKVDFEELKIKIYTNAINETDDEYNTTISDILVNGTKVNYFYDTQDNSTLTIDLLETLNVGERIEIEINYVFEYWDTDRISNYGDYFMTMFFYPVVAMYDDEGWNTDQFSFHGEVYYNEMCDYYLNLDVPKFYKVATGGKINSVIKNDTTYAYDIELIKGRDFSFSASLQYALYENVINGIDVEIYTINDLEQSELDFLYQIVEDSFILYEDILGDYYYDKFTIELGNVFGMESSGIIYCDSEINEITIVHEIVHQWLFGIIGNDQGDESWLDEGLTTFATGLYFMNNDIEVVFNDFQGDYYDFYSSLRFDDFHETYKGDTILKNIHDFDQGYGYLVYYHGSTILNYYVDNILDGDYSLIYKAFQRYYDEFNGKIATIEEFLTILEEETGYENTKEYFYLHLNSLQELSNLPD